MPYRHLSGRYALSQTSVSKARSSAYTPRHLRQIKQSVSDALIRSGLEMSCPIDTTTIIALVETILAHLPRLEYGYVSAAPTKPHFRFASAELDILVCNDGTPALTGRPFMTTVIDDATGVIIAYAVGFGVPPLGELSPHLKNIPRSPAGGACISLFGGASA
ncbi:MAG: hypothetical protein ACYC5H_06435 [Methylovirgula sp.]